MEASAVWKLHLKALVKFSDTRFANSRRLVYRNIHHDMQAITSCLEEKKIEAAQDPTNAAKRKGSDEAKQLLGKVLNARFLLTLSGCADIYSQYGVIVNVVQQVSLLPHQRYDKFLKEVEILKLMSESLEDHAKCNELCKLSNERKCLWPLYHQATASLKEKGEICGIPILDAHETVAAGLSGQTRGSSRKERTKMSVEPTPVSKQQLAKLVGRIHSDMQDEVFSPEIAAVIDHTRKLLDLTAVSLSLKEPEGGYIKLAATTSEDVVQAIRSIPVRSLNDVSNQLQLISTKKS